MTIDDKANFGYKNTVSEICVKIKLQNFLVSKISVGLS